MYIYTHTGFIGVYGVDRVIRVCIHIYRGFIYGVYRLCIYIYIGFVRIRQCCLDWHMGAVRGCISRNPRQALSVGP